MFGWYYDKKELKNTPSAFDNINEDAELAYRKEGIKLIVDIGKDLNVALDTIATAALYFHRFYMINSFKQFSQYISACGCLFLASKVDETPKKLKDIINAAHNLLSDNQFSVFGEDPRREVVELEIILLQTIHFDLEIKHPYNYLLNYCGRFNAPESKKKQILHMAWTFVNNSLFTTLVLQWEPEILAVAFLYLAGRLSELEIEDWVEYSNGDVIHWWDVFIKGVSEDVLEDISHQILDIYSTSTEDNASSFQNTENIGINVDITKNLCYPYSTS